MFIGHYAVGFAAKRAAPGLSLGVLLFCAIFLDLIWPLFLLAGWEEVRIEPGATAFTPIDFASYPYSHSLLAALGWSLLAGGLFLARPRRPAGAAGTRVGDAAVIAMAILSHWILDAIAHRPDLPLSPGPGPKVGLGLWNSVTGTVTVEGLLFAAALALYLRTTRARDRTGRYALWAFVAFSVLAYAGNFLGPPPPGVGALALVGLSQWIVPLWGWWIDRHRELTAPTTLVRTA